jgi:hypothetical protein
VRVVELVIGLVEVVLVLIRLLFYGWVVYYSDGQVLQTHLTGLIQGHHIGMSTLCQIIRFNLLLFVGVEYLGHHISYLNLSVTDH